MKMRIASIGLGILAAALSERSAHAACPPPSPPPSTASVLNVLDFGAIPGDGLDDRPAIQAAVDCAATLPSRTVYFPGGVYNLTSGAIVANVSDLILAGGAGAEIFLDPAANVIDVAPEAVLVNLVVGGVLQPVSRVAIRDLLFVVHGGSNGNTSFGVIQLNDCVDCLVSNVNLTWDPNGPVGTAKPQNVDGIVMSQGSSGAIRSSIVDGLPKSGIYLAQGTHDATVEGCEVRNSNGPLGRTGIVVTGAIRVAVANCRSHDNSTGGLLIGTSGLGVPARDVAILGGQYYSNGTTSLGGMGIYVNSALPDALPKHVQLTGVAVFSNVGGPGIQITGAEDVEISSPIVYDNGQAGILIETPIWAGSKRTNAISVSAPMLYDNGCSIVRGSGVQVNSADLVTLSQGKIYDSADRDMSACTQPYAILLTQNAHGQPNSNIRVLDPDTLTALAPSGIISADPGAESSSGYYRMQGSGAPGALTGPIGSQYTDLPTGQVYRKTGAGWVTP